MNVFSGVGRIVRDIELRKTGTGKSVVNFTLAINRKYDRDQTDFISCISWDKTADFMSAYLGKGALVSIEGRIQTGSYEDVGGKTVYTTDVVVDNLQALESKAQREGTSPKFDKPVKDNYVDNEPVLDITSDDLPF